MNSFYKMNRDYREAYLKVKKMKLKKPDTVGSKNKNEVSSTSPEHSPDENSSAGGANAWAKEMEYMHYSEKYPGNINYKEFMTYMIYPTFTY
jgi:hypothetical protein